MFESTTGPERPSWSGWFAVLAAALFLTAAALLAACGGEPQPGSPAGPAAAPDTTGTNTPVPTDGSGTAATVRASTQPGSPAERAAQAQPSDTVEPGDASRLDTGTPGEDREGSGDATEPGPPDGDTAPQSDEVEGAGADQPPEPAPDGPTALQSDREEQSLAGTSWALVSVGGGPAVGNVEVEFSEGSRISGWTGCNSYDGRYRASRSSFTIEELYWTEAGCPSHEMFLQESLYTDLLVDAAEFAISGSRLTITSSDGRTITFALRQ